MLVDLLYRIRAAPFEYLGKRSLWKLDAFHLGYSFSPFRKSRDYPDVFLAIRDWVIRMYNPSFDISEKDAVWILQEIVQDDERAFDLFFDSLDSAIAARPDIMLKPVEVSVTSDRPPLAASSFLNALGERPFSLLRSRSVGCLRAFLDGYSLAAVEEHHGECADLEGFEHWIREKLHIKGMFRWERAVFTNCQGDEVRAFEWAIRELKEYRATKGPISDRNYEFKIP
jgi:hypothetical protein